MLSFLSLPSSPRPFYFRPSTWIGWFECAMCDGYRGMKRVISRTWKGWWWWWCDWSLDSLNLVKSIATVDLSLAREEEKRKKERHKTKAVPLNVTTHDLMLWLPAGGVVFSTFYIFLLLFLLSSFFAPFCVVNCPCCLLYSFSYFLTFLLKAHLSIMSLISCLISFFLYLFFYLVVSWKQIEWRYEEPP